MLNLSGRSSCYDVTSLGEGIREPGRVSNCCNVAFIGEGVYKANAVPGCFNIQGLTDDLCKVAGIRRVNGAVDLINQVINFRGAKILLFSFSRMWTREVVLILTFLPRLFLASKTFDRTRFTSIAIQIPKT